MQAVEQVEQIDSDNTNSFPEFYLISDQTEGWQGKLGSLFLILPSESTQIYVKRLPSLYEMPQAIE